jgi:hypothetical protein
MEVEMVLSSLWGKTHAITHHKAGRMMQGIGTILIYIDFLTVSLIEGPYNTWLSDEHVIIPPESLHPMIMEKIPSGLCSWEA